MPRIFACLAVANVLLIIASGTLGLFAPSFGTDRHVLLAVLTLLFSCFVQVVTFTYLTVTGKMIGQAVHLARLDSAITARVKSFKRSITRNLAAVFGTIVLVAATGASGWRAGSATTWHLMASIILFAAHLWIFVREFEVVILNSNLVEQTLRTYESARSSAQSVQRP